MLGFYFILGEATTVIHVSLTYLTLCKSTIILENSPFNKEHNM